jgi:hypothetical protein
MMSQAARRLNHEGFHPPKRAQYFTMSMVAGFLAKGGRSGPRPHALSAKGVLCRSEWLLTGLARRLRTPSATVHRWRKVGWVQARKLPVPGGHSALRADMAEVKRLTPLREYQRTRRDLPILAELTTPNVRKKK